MNRLILILMLLALPAAAQTITTATITVTNTATTNGQTITVNGTVKTWTNSVYTAATDILTNNTAEGALTNLFAHYSSYPVGGGATLSYQSSTSLAIRSFPGQTLTVALSAGWGTSVSTTQSLTAASVVRVPYTVEGAAQRTNIASAVSSIIEGTENTNSINQNSFAVSELVGLTNAQTASGAKQFTSTTGAWYGYVSNATGISGIAASITNGHFKTNVFSYPILTNGVNYGGAFRSPGPGLLSEQFGTGASATGENSLAFGYNAAAPGVASIAFGNSAGYGNTAAADSSISFGAGAIASQTNSTAIGNTAAAAAVGSTALGKSSLIDEAHTNSTAIGASATTTAKEQIRLGTSSQYVSIPGGLKVDGVITNAVFGNTNSFPAGSDISFGRYALTSLANGNNAGIVVGTNVFIQVSGPSAAFAVNGIAGGRDGKLIVILNYTGFDMSIAHDSGVDATAANRIYTLTGADRTTTGNGAATLIYSGSASRWILISFDP